MVNLVKHDLEFILKQIKIAEAHAAGGDLRKLVAEAGGLDPNAATTPTQAFLLPYGLRTVDGTYNNLVEGRETWGAADQPFPVLTPPDHVDENDDPALPLGPTTVVSNNDYGQIGGNVVDSDPRIISNLVADQTLNNPAAISAALTYAGITGAAQMTAIAQIQAARAAIAQAEATAGSAPGAIPDLQAAVDAAEEALADAQAAFTAAQTQASTDQSAHATAVTNLAAAQQAFNDAKAVFDAMNGQLGIATLNLNAAEQVMEDGQAAVNAAQARVDASAAALQDARDAVATATAEKAAAEAELSSAQTQLAQHNAAHAAAVEARDAAQQELDAAQAVLDGLIASGADDLSDEIAQAQVAVDTAQQALNDAQNTVNGAQAQVGLSTAEVESANDRVNAATTELANAEAALAPLQAEADADYAAHQTALTNLASAQQTHDEAKAAYDAIMADGVDTEDPVEWAAFLQANAKFRAAQTTLAESKTAEADAKATADASAAAADAAQADVDAATTELNDANTALAGAQLRLEAAQSAYDAAVDLHDLAQTALQDAQSVLDGLNEQSEAYADALADVEAARQVFDDRQADVDAAFAEVGLSTVAVEAANSRVNAATTELANAEQAVEAAEAQLAEDVAFHATTVATLANAEDAMNDAQAVYDFVSTRLQEANDDYVAAQEALATAQTNETDARATASESAAAVTEARADVTTAATELTAAEDALADAQGASQAVTAAQTALANLLSQLGIQMDGNTVLIPNVAPDIGDSAPYNSLFTLFGQFFDHGLDLIAKGGSGTVYIPLQPDDPLYVPGSHTNFMALTRAAVPGGENMNVTTPWVDQNQTYTSHPSHQVFLREYTTGPDGKPVATGRLLDGERGLATWADIKAQARDMLGIDLTDADVSMVPLLRTDPYGNFIPDPDTGYAQVIVGFGNDGTPNTSDDIVISGTKDAPVSLATAARTAHAFLDDIAHAAVPVVVGGVLQNDGDSAVGYANADGSTTGLVNTRGQQTAYDDELLDAHYITGDGRGNENIGLTAIHHVFHSEHNHLVDQVKSLALSSGDLGFLNEWLLVPVTAIPTTDADKAALKWDGERLFQVARFTNEMEYQHLVFEEFARKMQPDVDAFVFEPSVDINPAIFAEFAQAVYRFGHSMLNENIDMITVNGQQISMTLFEGFLNPLEFGATNANGEVVVDHEQAAGAIIRGMSRQHGNEIDEFVTHVLRNQLVGIPLDLAALNIARGRDLGLPSLNEARAQFYQMAGQDSQLKPYVSWADFALNLQNSLSIVNFIAAYGKHQSILDATTMEAKRAAAALLVFGGTGAPEDRLDFLNSEGDWTTENSGLNDIDLWMGGLAEKKMDFGGMLGSTFSFVFEAQLEALQDADRFYYLSRVQGLNLLNELENNSMTDIIMRNTDLGDEGRTALPGDIFATPAHTLEMIISKQVGADPVWDNPVLQALSPLVVRKDVDGDGDLDVLIYNGTDHVVMGGTSENDLIVAGEGDDTVWGYEGNDTIEAGYGVDIIHGGKGDDIITNAGTDIGMTDKLHGEEGNDVIQGGSGLALLFGNQGQDFLIAGPDGKQVFGGTDNDFILGGDGGDFLMGNEGDDWIEGGARFDTLAGENSELFFNSSIIGHDVLNAGTGDGDYDAESGDDIMFQAEGIQRNNGMAGFDWAIHKGDNVAANSDLGIPLFDNQEAFILRDRFDLVEGLSGWKHNDILTGRVAAVNTRAEATGTAAIPGPDSPLESFSNDLLQKNVALINGLDDLVAHRTRIPVVDAQGRPVLDANGNQEMIVLDTSQAADIILGGGGSDTIKGFAGDDIIDGDKWLNVRIRITTSEGVFTADGMTGKVYRDADYDHGAPKDGATPVFDGKTLDALMLSATINPGQLSIVREIVDGDLNDSANDVAVYGDVRANYTFTKNADGSFTVEHVNVTIETDPTTGNNRLSDGTDRLFNIEYLQFADQKVLIAQRQATGAPTLSGTENVLTANTDAIADLNGLGTFSFQWEFSNNLGATWTPINGATQRNYTVPDNRVGQFIRVVVSFTDDAGNQESVASVMTARIGSNSNFNGDNFTGTAAPNLINGRNGNDTLSGLEGDDVINGGAGNDSITGAAGNDAISGGTGNDTIDGGDGNDTIDGGSGNNVLNGGAGNDVFLYEIDGGGATSTFNGGADTDAVSIFDSGTGSETLTVAFNGTRLTQVEAATINADIERVVADLGAGNADAIDYSTATSGVTVDLSAGTASGFAAIAGIENVVGSNNADTLIGDGSANVLDGRGGADTLRGLGGNDTYVVDNVGDVVDESAAGSGGVDRVETALASYTLTAGVENLEYTANGAFTGIGNALNNVIDGGGGGDNLSGLDGLDILNGNGGNDTIDGGAGNDTLDGATGNDVLNGGGDNDAIFGGSGNDTMNGGAGNDVLDGGSGVDRMTGGDGTDTFAFDDDETGTGANRDVITDFVQGVDKINLAAMDANRSTFAFGDQDFTFIGTGAFTNGGQVRYRYDAGTNQTIVEGRSASGIFGQSTIAFEIALSGQVTLTAADFIGITNAPAQVNQPQSLLSAQVPSMAENASAGTVVASLMELAPEAANLVSFSLQGASSTLFEIRDGNVVLRQGASLDFETQRSHELTVVLTDSDGNAAQQTFKIEVENIGGSVKGSSRSESCQGTDEEDRMEGGRGHDRLHGNSGDDQLRGGDGNDRLYGGEGSDRMWGGKGNDVYYVDSVDDRVYESRNQGIDTVSSSVSHKLGSNFERLFLTGSDDVNGTGNSLANVLKGNAGDNILKGGGGRDTMSGGAGEDRIYGNSSHDRLYGGNGEDRLYGGSGDDRLVGGKGDDFLQGNSGRDIFVFERNGGRDTVTDFRDGHDRIDARSLSKVDSLSDLHVARTGDDTVITHGDDVLVLRGVSPADLDQTDFIF
ncbi:peroxidase family protein [Microvirga sp. VF16]|uniref:peroxidase family protein n=1 Tax=Microvirga sp. VF16 TaxID=2807101 RepID=UPI00193E081B|nr:peroxidase family protein [Microvirga sp. VF16]QRM30323.1 M10 family metallopeptidase C-terminal domain-containing protein [Microvirga sp. VF16]